jgi:PAS domain S-box-containing protein
MIDRFHHILEDPLFLSEDALFNISLLLGFSSIFSISYYLLHFTEKNKKTSSTLLKKYTDLYENSPILNRTINLDGILINCNKAYADTFGYKKDEIIGKSIFDFVPVDHRDLLMTSFTSWRNTGNIRNREIIFKKKDGTLFPALLSATNLFDEQGNRIGSNTTIIDISNIKKAEQEIEDLKEKKLTVIGELTARIAHDLRNPLSVIKNSADIIKMETPDMDEKSLQNWRRLERGVDRIKHQVDDVLDYVRTTPLEKKLSSLNQIIQDAMERIEITSAYSINIPEKDKQILCDSEKLETVFVNLMMNAIQAMAKDSGSINITVEKDIEDFIKINFEDSGPGISSDLISKIFDPLFTTRQIGTGLGLPSCKNIIEKHGGSLEVSSPPGKGAIFEIILPKSTEWTQLPSEEDEQSVLNY